MDMFGRTNVVIQMMILDREMIGGIELNVDIIIV